ncbi:MAG: hypothetical protein ACI8Y9_001681, partial [Paracoccaceae bacterium]
GAPLEKLSWLVRSAKPSSFGFQTVTGRLAPFYLQTILVGIVIKTIGQCGSLYETLYYS